MRRSHSKKQAGRKPKGSAPAMVMTLPKPRLVGYARVSTEDQNLDVQLAALRAAGVQEGDLFIEKISAVNAKRDEFNLMMKHLWRGDTLLIHSLSRLGRNVDQLRGILKTLEVEGVAWRSLTEPQLDTTTAVGKFMVSMTGAMAQLERDQISERTKRGMAECKRQGMYLGAPIKVTPADAKIMKALRKRGVPVPTIAQQFNVSNSAVYSHT